MSKSRTCAAVRPTGMALAIAALTSLAVAPAHAVVTVAGSYFTYPGTSNPNSGSIPDALWLGNMGNGTLAVNGGSVFTAAALYMAWTQGTASGTVSGAGTAVVLNSLPIGNRLLVGAWGSANLTVNSGAQINANGNDAACNGGCSGGVGDYSGSIGSLLVTGAGSSVSVRDTFSVANGFVTDSLGTPGATTSGTLQLFNGGKLISGGGKTGGSKDFPVNAAESGTEQRTAVIQIDGANSVWQMTAPSNTIAAERNLSFITSGTNNSLTTLNITNGGKLQMDPGAAAGNSWIWLSDRGGLTRAKVDGAGSAIEFISGSNGRWLDVGREGGTAFLDITNGGAVSGLLTMQIATTGSLGTVIANGIGSRITLDGSASGGRLSVANGFGANGSLNVSGGATVNSAIAMDVGVNRGNGRLNVIGAGSSLQFISSAAGGGFSWIGDGEGSVGNLSLESGAVMTGVQDLRVGVARGIGSAYFIGSGTQLSFAANVGANLIVGEGGVNGNGFVEVRNGAVIDNAMQVTVGLNGGNGTMQIENGSRVSLIGNGRAGTFNANNAPSLTVGSSGANGGGHGDFGVYSGSTLEVRTTATKAGAPSITVGRLLGDVGRMVVANAGSNVQLTSANTAAVAGIGTARNPFMFVGQEGNGELIVGDGGVLNINGQAASTAASARTTYLGIGGNTDSTTLGAADGRALVTGAGSKLSVSGADAFLIVGRGAGNVGRLTVLNGGSVESTLLNVGRVGTGLASLNGSTMTLSGQFTSSATGAGLAVGMRGGNGLMTLANASRLDITNMGTAGASISLGGTSASPLGNGQLLVSGGSAISISTAAGLGLVQVGRDGTGTLRVSGASTFSAGTSDLFIGRLATGIGSVVVEGGSSLTAAFVGVGSDKNAGFTPTGGGVATMIINGSDLWAPEVVIGAKGYLGGNGTIHGHVTNGGVFNPGNSPGTFVIDGSFSSVAGGKLVLEVESDGAGGFLTDKLVFTANSTFDLSGLNIEFKFLGDTNPNFFQSSGKFGTDTFFKLRAANGSETALAPGAFAGALFTAQSDAYQVNNFSFTTAGGATFTSTAPVPEPGTWALMLLGLLGMTAAARRRN